LRDLDPVTAIVSITEAIRADHRAGLDQAILADLNLMVNGHIGPQTRAGTDFRIFPNEAACADHHVIAQYNTGFDNRVSADRHVVTQLRRRRDILCRLRRGIKNLSHARVGQVGITHYQRGAMGKRQIILRHDNGRSLTSGQVFTVLRVDHESDLARFRALHGRNAGDDDIAITV